MSNWIEAREEDVNVAAQTVHIWLSSDNNGNNYLDLPKSVVEKIIELQKELDNG